ncbi:nuclear transport factor 2 family protein [Sphingomonas sp. CGMCC 1.13654]|uniref:Nuclear transport factor 2 family protein n=1 Tax=Sphingomonas chungangi TaxID=2683589 RepID=A0A838L758_9SPHN|nr:nuclear transport factor 2 family protein [Sphingomonas chungangi]MBA2933976.1 nuclear transport factor 2 family protein [Sphingomonas chungangi]MVW57101.1 hypothetical protein [Sphingomonas chungangi]
MSHRIDRIDDRLAIERLTSDFGHALDRGNVEAFVNVFIPDAVYTNGTRVLVGHAALRDFFLARAAAGPRTSRHMVTGLRIDFVGDADARGLSICATFSAAGTAEIPCTIPAIVADFVDRYQRLDGHWRIAERTVIPLFRASTSHG